jgi:hypothetical protein
MQFFRGILRCSKASIHAGQEKLIKIPRVNMRSALMLAWSQYFRSAEWVRRERIKYSITLMENALFIGGMGNNLI